MARSAGLAAVSHLLRCPVGRHAAAAGLQLDVDGARLRCDDGHSFDVARQGHVNLLGTTSGSNADTPAMLGARERVLAAGVLDPVQRALSSACAGLPAAARLVDAGAGTGRQLAALVAERPGRVGLAMDVSPAAARQAARQHPRVGAVVADTWRPWPVRDRVVDAVLAVFAPRNPGEFARVLVPGGLLVVVTPRPGHLAELRGGGGLLTIAEDKERRLAAQLLGRFRLVDEVDAEVTSELARSTLADLVAMGPNAHHLAPAQVAAAVDHAAGRVTVAVRVSRFTPSD